ncbi:MAG: hypothetical protein ACI814_003109, partial [Mariniblastus sp.]
MGAGAQAPQSWAELIAGKHIARHITAGKINLNIGDLSRSSFL